LVDVNLNEDDLKNIETGRNISGLCTKVYILTFQSLQVTWCTNSL